MKESLNVKKEGEEEVKEKEEKAEILFLAWYVIGWQISVFL
jgi:hypothetical protein